MPLLEDGMVKKSRRTQETRISKEVCCSCSKSDTEDPLSGDIKLLTHRPDLNAIFSEMIDSTSAQAEQ
jgi:hypothetical protein